MRRRLVGVLCSLVVLTGCATHLETSELSPTGSRQGVGYVLPFTQFHVKVSWRVASCQPAFKIVPKIEFTQGSADDGDHAYLIDPLSLQSLLSVSSLSVKWQDGSNALASLNASVEDRSAQTIANVALGVGKLLTGAAAAGGPGATPCKQDTIDALAEVKKGKATLDGLSGQLDLAQATLTRVTAKVATMGANVDAGTKKELGDAIDAVTSAQQLVTEQSEALAELLKSITYVVEEDWPQKSTDFERDAPFLLPPTALDKWVTTAAMPTGEDAKLLASTSVYLRLQRTGSFGRTLTGDAPSDGYVDPPAEDSGLRYRMPAQGEIVACSVPGVCAESANVVGRLRGMIAQLGYVNVLPIGTRAFGSTTFAAEFTAAGGLKSAGYEQKTAPGEQMAAAFGNIAAAATPLLTWSETREAARQKHDLATLDYLTKRRDALTGLAVDPNLATRAAAAGFDADTAMAKAEVSSIEAQLALTQARARLAN